MTALHSNAGVTLVELIVVLSVAAVLLTIGVPSFTSFVNNTRLSSASTQLLSDLNQARSEAIKRNSRVLVCARNSAGTACSAVTNWQGGWLLCYDRDGDNACDAATASEPNPIIVRGALPTVLSLAGPAAPPVRFNPNGSQGGGAATLTLTGTWAGATARVVTIAATGFISKNW